MDSSLRRDREPEYDIPGPVPPLRLADRGRIELVLLVRAVELESDRARSGLELQRRSQIPPGLVLVPIVAERDRDSTARAHRDPVPALTLRLDRGSPHSGDDAERRDTPEQTLHHAIASFEVCQTSGQDVPQV